MTVDLNAVAVIGAAMTATGLFLLVYAARKGMRIMAGKHHQNPTEVEYGAEVTVDTESHEVVRQEARDRQPVIGRLRTTPTRHDGSQKKR